MKSGDVATVAVRFPKVIGREWEMALGRLKAFAESL